MREPPKKTGVRNAGTIEAGDWVDIATGGIAWPVLSAPSELGGGGGGGGGLWAMERREGSDRFGFQVADKKKRKKKKKNIGGEIKREWWMLWYWWK
jgi:hypothetical protein